MHALAVTVAAIIERQGRYLLAEECDSEDGAAVLNQPAGHVDPGETLLQAVVREAHEEAGVIFTPQYVVGVYQLKARNGQDYLRVAFAGTVPANTEAAPVDTDIIACHWLTREELLMQRPRSSLVLQCIDDYLAGQRMALESICAVYTDGPNNDVRPDAGTHGGS